MTRKYVVRTFGCQMNAHDSERISGLLEEDGMEMAEHEDDADVVVLNTCCIRENADEKLYGTLGWLKPWKEAGKNLGRERQIVVAGCLAQKDKDLVREKAPYVDVVMGTHNVHQLVLACTASPLFFVALIATFNNYFFCTANSLAVFLHC